MAGVVEASSGASQGGVRSWLPGGNSRLRLRFEDLFNL
jgi:hypothetical protein